MEKFSRPIVGISKCLEFDNCRFDGGRINNILVRKMKNHVNFVSVCPEAEMGLGTPRKPVRLVRIGGEKNLYQPSSKQLFTSKMKNFSNQFISSNKKFDGFIFKSRSPSCGIDNARMYNTDGPNSGFDKTAGLFTEGIMEKFPYIAKEDEKRLNNFSIRENFLTRLFTLAGLREAIESGNIELLSSFYLKNKLLFMTHNETNTQELERLLKNKSAKDFQFIANRCRDIIHNTLNSLPKKQSTLSAYHYIYSLIRSKLSHLERSYYCRLVEEFKENLVSNAQILTLLFSWGLRCDMKSIYNQSIFNPFPKTLLSDLLKPKKEYLVI